MSSNKCLFTARIPQHADPPPLLRGLLEGGRRVATGLPQVLSGPDQPSDAAQRAGQDGETIVSPLEQGGGTVQMHLFGSDTMPHPCIFFKE